MPTPLGDFNPSGGGAPNRAPPPLKKAGTTYVAPDGGKPDNVPVVSTIGQGLSKKLKADAEQAVATAMSACRASSDGKYEDHEFPPNDTSLGCGASSVGVTSWRRLGEIEPCAPAHPRAHPIGPRHRVK